MYPRFQTTSKGTSAYIQKTVREGSSTRTITVRCLGLLSDIQREYGCEDPEKWVRQLAAQMTSDEREAVKKVTLELSPVKPVAEGSRPLLACGDLMLLPLYNSLGLPGLCRDIQLTSRARYDLNEILKTLVVGRILFPRSKKGSYEQAQSLVRPPSFGEHDMYRALSLLCGHINDIQAGVYRNSLSVMPRRDKVIFYDCTNFYFETEATDKDYAGHETGEFVEGLRRYGKSKEHRPNPIVQMGMFMDYDGIPLAFCIFPGNSSEQTSIQPLEETLQRKFGLTEFVVSTDAGLGSEENRLYNMEGAREYITVQSLKKLKEPDLEMALRPEGWHVGFRAGADRREPLDPEHPQEDTFNLDRLRSRPDAHGNLKDTTFFKEIVVEKELTGKDGNTTRRKERIIVTYNHDFALYQRTKRREQVNRATKIVKGKSAKSRQAQQDPRRFVEVSHLAVDGTPAVKTEMKVDYAQVAYEEKFDGFYAYGTSLDDDAVDVLRIRSFHHEIEHLFRTTKTFLEARPVFLSRQDRIRSHFLTCFIAMVILKMLQRQLTTGNAERYSREPLTIDRLIETLGSLKVGHFPGYGYVPMFTRTELTDQLQHLVNVDLSTEIVPTRRMNKYYRNVK